MEEFQIPPPSKINYLNAEYGVKSWLLTRDHKRIGLLYLASVTFFFFIGGIYAMLIRLELLTPQGDLLSSATYNKVFTQHGIIMVFFFLIPSIPATLGNFLVPMMIGAKDLAFPRINLLSWYIYVLGGLVTIYALLAGGVDTGWTFYVPYSTTFSNSYVIAAGLGVFINGFSSILTGLNFIVTIHTMRAPGMTWFRLPLFIWAHYATSLIFILGTPVIAITILLVAFERLAHIGIFDPAAGGDPVRGRGGLRPRQHDRLAHAGHPGATAGGRRPLDPGRGRRRLLHRGADRQALRRAGVGDVVERREARARAGPGRG